MPQSRPRRRPRIAPEPVGCEVGEAPSSTSPVHQQIVEDFLQRAEEDSEIPDYVVRQLRRLFEQDAPKKDAFVEAFRADEDVE